MPASRPSELTSASTRSALATALLLSALLFGGGCEARTVETDDAPDAGRPADVERAPVEDAPAIPEEAPKVAFLGDSIAAGLHLARDEAFPAVLQRRLAKDGHPFHLINAGVSGDTTAGGAARVEWLLSQAPDVVVIELGANDGFRGVPLETVEQNLREIVASVKQADAVPLLLGIRLPPNYGENYAGGFDELYDRVAKDTGSAYVPYFMKDVAGLPEMNLPDGIHPTPAGHRKLAENVSDTLADVLSALPTERD